MRLRELLPPDHIRAPLQAGSVRAAIMELIEALERSDALHDAALVERQIAEAGARAIVPVGERAILPHLRTDAVDQLVLALGVAPDPLDARDTGVDVAPQIVALVLAPPEAASLYLQTVSTLARLIRRDDLVATLAGAASAEDVLRITELGDARIQAALTARDMMSQRPAVPPAASVRDAVAIMIDQRLKALPVVGDKGEVLGIVSEWDVMRALLPQIPRADSPEQPAATRMPQELTVREIMARSVLCIAEDMGLDDVVNLMVNKAVEHFPVVGGGKLVGFLSRGDIIRKLFGR